MEKGLYFSLPRGKIEDKDNLHLKDPAMKHYTIAALPKKDISPGITLSSVFLENLMVTFVTLEQDAVLPDHSHPHEQITVIISGALLFKLEGREVLLRGGDTILVPSGAMHGGVVTEGPCVAYDSWSPVREDYKIPETPHDR